MSDAETGKTRTATKFFNKLFSLAARPAAKAVFYELFGFNLQAPSETRWFSFHACVDKVLPIFHQLPQLFEKLDEAERCTETVKALKVHFRRKFFLFSKQALIASLPCLPQLIWTTRKDQLVVETLCIKLLGDILIHPTYRLEGDSFLLPFVTEEVNLITRDLKRLVRNGVIPKKPYNLEDFDTLDMDQDDTPRKKGCAVDFIRQSGLDSSLADAENSRKRKFHVWP